MQSAKIFSIEEFSVFDGPGIRSTVFLMGCPLRCEWCHNPEGQSTENIILRSPNGCIRCGACEKHAVTRGGKRRFTEASIQSCPNNLLRYAATEYTAEALCEKLAKNFAILNASGGGVTFSGGEPTASPDFLLECLARLEGKVHRAVQTCGYAAPALFKRVLIKSDYILFDIKLVKDAAHRKYTGCANAPILKNLETLANSNKDFVIRTPLIPTVTDTEENLAEIAALLSAHGIKYIELLPYNKMTGAKYPLTGRAYEPSFDGTRPAKPRTELFAKHGIEAKII